MRPPGGRLRRLVRAMALLLAPAAAALIVLALSGEIAWPGLLLGIAAALVLGALMVRRHLGRLDELTRALGQARDEVAAARRELEAVVSSNAAVFGALPDPLIMISAERRILRANPAAEELFEAPLAGRELTSVLRNPELLGAVDDVLRGAEGRRAEFVLPGAVARYFTARVARLGGAAPNGTRAVVALHDLTAVKRAEQMRADFVANASHELRTPLASLLGFIETLRDAARDDPEARERFLAVMHEQARRMARLVEDLLSLSRIELLEHTPPRGTAALADVLRSLVNTLQPQADAKGMRFDLALADLPPVSGNADELAQVFQNLLDNAIKYGRAGTPVRIAGRVLAPGAAGARRLGRPGVAISVEDRGDGIAREHVPRLTERFYRVDAARSRKLGGTGLGLAIVKHILNRHRGVLEIESTPGKGSVFIVYLPLPGSSAGAGTVTQPSR